MRLTTILLVATVVSSAVLGEMSAGSAQTESAAPPQKAAALDPARLSAAQSTLGFRLIERMSKADAGGNVIVSPGSLAAVLSLLDLGANQQLRDALFKTLAFRRTPGEDRAATLAALRTSVTSPPADGVLESANLIVFDPKAPPNPAVLPALADTGTEVKIDQLDDPSAIQRINDWVKARTHGLIPSILDRASDRAGLVALNALHFKDRWKAAFDPSLTRPALFQTVGGVQSDVPMMHYPDGSFHFRRDGRFVAVELPYENDRYRLVVITTTEKPARAVGFRRVAGWLAGQGFDESSGAVSMPRLTLGSSADLLGTLDALGLKRGRSSSGALAGLSPSPLTISQVLQRTEIRVDEAGTEAAAATAATATRSALTGFVKMVVDKPFLFALRDTTTGLILLSGYVQNPRSSPN